MEIYVQTNGFVRCGERADNDAPPGPAFIKLVNAAVVRIYGTTAGLGELAEKGPLPETKLDPEADGTDINLAYVLAIIPCNDENWKKWIEKQSWKALYGGDPSKSPKRKAIIK